MEVQNYTETWGRLHGTTREKVLEKEVVFTLIDDETKAPLLAKEGEIDGYLLFKNVTNAEFVEQIFNSDRNRKCHIKALRPSELFSEEGFPADGHPIIFYDR